MSGVRRLYFTLYFHWSVFLLLLSTFCPCQPTLQITFQFLLSFTAFFILLLLIFVFYLHFSPCSPGSSRPCIQPCPFWIILPTWVPSFLILSSAHQGTTTGLVPAVLCIPPSYSLRASAPEPPQDLSLYPQSYRIRGNPRAFSAHELTAHLSTRRRRAGRG